MRQRPAYYSHNTVSLHSWDLEKLLCQRPRELPYRSVISKTSVPELMKPMIQTHIQSRQLRQGHGGHLNLRSSTEFEAKQGPLICICQ